MRARDALGALAAGLALLYAVSRWGWQMIAYDTGDARA